jgi:outer membrane biosynthesis protein TonB
MGLIAILLLLLQSQDSAPRIRVGSTLGSPRMTRYVRPVYPKWARMQNIEGRVEFVAAIGKDGKVHDLSVVKGPKLLVPFAQAAIGKWGYEAAALNGERVEVKTAILVDFTLSQ